MIARGQFHIRFRDLLVSFINLWSRSYANTNKVHRFKESLGKHFKAHDLVLFSSCRIAFEEFLRSQKFKEGDEVLLCPITIPDMINAIKINKLKPVFVEMDISNHSFCISDLENKISSRTCLILNTNLSGLNNLNGEINKISKKNNLVYIDDISQAPMKDYFTKENAADFALVSMSIGKTITSLVGGVLLSKDRDLGITPTIRSGPKRYYFFHQLIENLKIELITSNFIYRFITRHLLTVVAKINPQKYLNIHLTNTISKFSEKDIFFDDIPVSRDSFPDDLYFPFNNWMASLGERSLRRWYEINRLRSNHRETFLSLASDDLKRHVAKVFLDDGYFPTRVPIYVDDVNSLSLYSISDGLDMGGYGLNLCSEEEVFDEYRKELSVSHYIKFHCLFLNLSEKVSKKDLIISIDILNNYFEEDRHENS